MLLKIRSAENKIEALTGFCAGLLRDAPMQAVANFLKDFLASEAVIRNITAEHKIGLFLPEGKNRQQTDDFCAQPSPPTGFVADHQINAAAVGLWKVEANPVEIQLLKPAFADWLPLAFDNEAKGLPGDMAIDGLNFFQ